MRQDRRSTTPHCRAARPATRVFTFPPAGWEIDLSMTMRKASRERLSRNKTQLHQLCADFSGAAERLVDAVEAVRRGFGVGLAALALLERAGEDFHQAPERQQVVVGRRR